MMINWKKNYIYSWKSFIIYLYLQRLKRHCRDDLHFPPVAVQGDSSPWLKRVGGVWTAAVTESQCAAVNGFPARNAKLPPAKQQPARPSSSSLINTEDFHCFSKCCSRVLLVDQVSVGVCGQEGKKGASLVGEVRRKDLLKCWHNVMEEAGSQG